MRKLYILFFIITTFYVKGQNNCNPTYSPAVIFYPNSTNSPTTNFGYEFLCGPNTTVYDTLEQGCHFIYVNSGCTLFLKPTFSCLAQSEVWLKNNSVLNIVQGAGLIQIYYELGAIINNQYSVTISSTSCTAITFPIVNCTVTGLVENNFGNNIFETYPNPVNDKLNIKFSSNEKEITKLQIINCVGQVVKEIDLENDTSTININDLRNGIYVLNIKSKSSLYVSKRFIVEK